MARGDLTKEQLQEAETHGAAIDAICSWLDDIKGQLQEDFDDASEKWQESEKGEALTELIEHLEEGYEKADELRDLLNELSGGGE